ncbi:Ribonucleoside-diphosphate reductase large chain [Nosema granulosis]|uniref:Ribonucleoside-diphosphate reductase n=1 Tax=Nosema granulosis TaxID=83296 RepID=A0A9P6GY03_9MICR|nr:Ribonucleoside-diphosphate reductase large chain [Nosema granulosis]
MDQKRLRKNIVIDLEVVKEKIKKITSDLGLDGVDYNYLIDKIESGWCCTMSSQETVNYVSETAASMTTIHPQYGRISSHIIVEYLHLTTFDTFSEKIEYIQKHRKIISPDIYMLVNNHREKIDKLIDYQRDYSFSYFAIVSLMKSYLIHVEKDIVERPQDVFMRVALQLHKDDWERVEETYNLISTHHFTHATPTLYNSGLTNPQLASCFLLTPKEDSIEGIYDTIKQCAVISKYSGGIGLNLHCIRSRGAPLKTTGGTSQGVIPLIQVLNSTRKYINQGGGKRSSSIAIYLEPWHKDIFDFLELRKNTGQEELRARSIFIGLWINDLFMERVQKNEEWSLFCPNDVQNLEDLWGEEFNKMYERYEKTKNRTVVPAQKLWKAIIEAQIETGTPYMVYKDTCNRLSNQQNLGTIKCSNLCTEIVEYSSPEETAVCNLASICLPKFIKNGLFDFEKLRSVVKVITRNLNKAIDSNFYPVVETERSNLRHRPIGLGVQGLANLFAILRLPFDSLQARNLNKAIFEDIYFSALEASCELAQSEGPYETYEGSPLSKGLFHFELCNKPPANMERWEVLRAKIQKHGVRNSLFVAPMPTASTSQIFNNNECFEPFTSNIYSRRTHAGEFQVVNETLLEELISLNLWSYDLKNLLIEHEGSVQNIPAIPKEIKDIYKTAWEISMKAVIDLAADRQPFIDQSQSLNLFLAKPTYSQLTSMHFYAYKSGLKTGMYYLRTRPISSAIKFTVDQKLAEKTLSSMVEEDCSMCSS